MRGVHRVFVPLIFMVALSCPIGRAQGQVAIKGWGTFVDPVGDCSARQTKGRLTIQVPGTLHDLAAEATSLPHELDAPRVLSPVSNDFRAQVRVLGSVTSGGVSTSSYFLPYHGEGLLLWQDDANYIRLERASYVTSTDTVHYVNFELRKDGQNVHSVGLNTSDEPISLKLERIGNTVTAYASQDGVHFWKFEPITVDFPNSVMIGVDAVNTSSLPIIAVFDQFRVTPIKRRHP